MRAVEKTLYFIKLTDFKITIIINQPKHKSNKSLLNKNIYKYLPLTLHFNDIELQIVFFIRKY